MHRLPIILLLAAFALSTTACFHRIPSTKSAQHHIQRYFKHYGKKYPETDFGKYKVDEVEVNSLVELQRDMALAIAFVSLGDGDIVYKVSVTLVKKTIRWKVVSWENLGKAG